MSDTTIPPSPGPGRRQIRDKDGIAELTYEPCLRQLHVCHQVDGLVSVVASDDRTGVIRFLLSKEDAAHLAACLLPESERYLQGVGDG